MTKEQIHIEAEKIRTEHQAQRRLALRLVSLGRVLERLKGFSPGAAIPEGMVNRLWDFAHYEDLPNRISKELWGWLHRIEAGEYTVEPDTRTWPEVCADLEKQGIVRCLSWPEWWAVCWRNKWPYNGPELSEEQKVGGLRLAVENEVA